MTLLWEMAVRRRLTNDAQTSPDRPAYSVLSRAARHCFLHPRAIASVAKMARRCRYCCRCLVTPPPIGNRSIVMSVSVCVRVCVCVCVCLSGRDHIFGTTRLIFTKIFVRVTYGRGSFLIWRRNDTLCTSSFMDDVIFVHKSRLLDVAAQLKRSAHAAFGLAVNCAQ